MTIITNLSGNVSTATWSLPAVRSTIVDRQNVGFMRNIIMTPDGMMITKGTHSIGFPIQELLNIAASKDANLTWAPFFNTQPSNVSVAAPNTASFTISANSEIPLTYQWQNSGDNGGNWTNLSSSSPYSNVTTNNLTINPSNVNISNFLYRCIATSNAGNNTSNSGKLTVT